jgi:predicted permease
MAVRASLGASRGRLIGQLLAESTVLATLGAIAGTVLSLAGVRILTATIPENTLAYFTKFTIDGFGFAVLCVMCLGTVFIFGLAPALHVSRTDVSHVMKDGGRGRSTGVKARRWTMVFLTAEFGLTMVLLAALASSVRVARVAQRAAAAIDPTGIVTASIAATGDRYRSDEQRLALYRQLEERLGAAPGVASVAVASALPLNGGAARHLIVDGRSPVADTSATVMTVAIGVQYFDVVRAPLVRGRAFADRDGSAGYESAIVNERLAEMYFPQGDAIGRRVRLADTSSAQPIWLTIVGVSPKVRQRAVTEPDPVLYLPLRSAPPASAVVAVRSRADVTELVALLRETVRGIDPELPIYRVRSMEQALLDAEWNGRVSKRLLNTIALVAMLLAAVGLYAVSTHTVVQRKMELGIRMALGARGTHIIWMVARRAVVQLASGLVAGVALTLAFEKLVGIGVDTSGVRMSDPPTLVAAASLLAIVTAIACVAPVVRASRLDPVQALRSE